MPLKQLKLLKRQAIRQTILDVAKDIAAKEGWQHLTIRKICQQIEYSAPIVYQHFESKDHILQALRADAMNLMLQRIAQIHETEKDAHKQLIIFGIAFWHFAIANPELYQVMFNLQGAICSPDGKTFPVTEIHNFYKMAIKSINDKARKDEKELLFLLDYYVAIIHGFIAIKMVNKIKSGNDEAEKVFRNSLKHFVKSIEAAENSNEADEDNKQKKNNKNKKS